MISSGRQQNNIFVLVRPVFLGNIGATARVLKNFSFSNLRLVEPPKNYKDAEARKMSVGAFDILKHAQVFASLSEALQDISLAVGTSSGQQREQAPVSLACVLSNCQAVAAANKVAWVFGDERNGLTKEELQRCHHTVTIPVNPQFPALNVAQAVGIIAYELSKDREAPEKCQLYAPGIEDDELFCQIDELLQAVQFSRTFNRQTVLKELRHTYQRLMPTVRERDLLKGVLHKINQKLES